MADTGDEPPGPDPSLGGLDEEILTARARARDMRREGVARRQAAAYARGMELAVFVLTGRLVLAGVPRAGGRNSPRGRADP